MTKQYLVPFDDSENHPWIESFRGNSLEDIEDKIVTYILAVYDIDEKIPAYYKDFKKLCKEEWNIYIGEITELEEYA